METPPLDTFKDEYVNQMKNLKYRKDRDSLYGRYFNYSVNGRNIYRPLLQELTAAKILVQSPFKGWHISKARPVTPNLAKPTTIDGLLFVPIRSTHYQAYVIMDGQKLFIKTGIEINSRLVKRLRRQLA